MKQRTMVRTGILAIAGLFVMASLAGAQNMLTNPSFDSDGTGWTPANEDIVATFLPGVGSTLAGGSGPGSLEIRYSFWNGSSGGVWQEVEVDEGTTYTMGVSSYVPTADNPAGDTPLLYQFYDVDGQFLEQDAFHLWPFVNDQWVRIEGTVTAPAGAVVVRVIAAVTNPIDPTGTLPGIAYFDDVWLSIEGAHTTVQDAFYPAGASVAGLAGTFWTTDGWFRSTSGAEVELYGAFLPQGENNTAAVESPLSLGTIPANGSVVIDDIIADLGGDDQTGGVYLRAEAIGGTQLPFLFATSYTSTPNPGAGGSYGQGIPAVGKGIKGLVVAPGAFQNSERRTNAGALNTSAHAISVRVVITDRNGATAGSQTWSLPPYSQRQVSLPNMGVTNLNGGSVVFELMSAVGSFRAYTSTVDAVTGDAVHTAAQ